jgi:hypothetical protein
MEDGPTERDADGSACASPPADLHCHGEDSDADPFAAGRAHAKVAKAIQARREDKLRRCSGEVVVDGRRAPGRHAAATGSQGQGRSTDRERKQPEKSDRQHWSGGGGDGRWRHWQPSLQSISDPEAAS